MDLPVLPTFPTNLPGDNTPGNPVSLPGGNTGTDTSGQTSTTILVQTAIDAINGATASAGSKNTAKLLGEFAIAAILFAVLNSFLSFQDSAIIAVILILGAYTYQREHTGNNILNLF